MIGCGWLVWWVSLVWWVGGCGWFGVVGWFGVCVVGWFGDLLVMVSWFVGCVTCVVGLLCVCVWLVG